MTFRHVTSPYVMTYYIILGWMPLCVLCLFAEMTENACPRGCTCDMRADRVDCTNAALDHIPWNLPKPGYLKTLIMKNNSVRVVSAEILYGELQYLDLSHNQIESMADGVFLSLPNLEYLNLQDNQLSRISERTFDAQSSSKLLALNLSKNEITSIEDGAFRRLNSLEELKLAYNRLSELSNNIFTDLSSLRYLYINNNRMTHLNSNVFQPISGLTTLLVDMNSIRNISEQTFQHLTHLRRLSLEGNGLTRLPEYLFSSKSNSPVLLEQLSIKNNKLEIIPTRTLQHLVNLQILDLSHNLFSLVSPDAFRGLDNLERLILNNCPNLAIIRDYSFSELPSLQTVEISSNPELGVIEKNAFISSHNIKQVQLEDNALRTLDVNLFEWDRLTELILAGNEWTCDCHLGYLADVLEAKLNQSSLSYSQIAQVRCVLPQSLARRSIVELDERDFTCNKSDVTGDKSQQFSSTIMVAIICTFAGALLTCLAFLIWRTRDVTFHNEHRNQTNYRRRRLRKINREFSKSECSEISEGPNVVRVSSYTSDKPLVNAGPQDQAFLDDDVFQNDPDIVTSSQRRGSSVGERCRKVSFSDRVVVRTYESMEDIESNCSTEDDGEAFTTDACP